MNESELADLSGIRQLWGSIFWSPDGAFVYYISDESGQRNLWRRAVGTGAAQQVTNLERDSVRMAQIAPDGAHMLLAIDHDGDEAYQLFLLPANGGEMIALTKNPSAQHLTYGPWAPTSQQIAYSANARDEETMDLWVMDLRTQQATLLLGDGRNYYPMGWTPDGRGVIAVELVSNSETNIFLVDVSTGAARQLTPSDGAAFYWPGPIPKDGSHMYLTTDRGADFTYLATVSIDGGEIEPLIEKPWDVEAQLSLSRCNRYLAWSTNEEGVSKLFVLDRHTGECQPLDCIPQGCIWNMSFGPQGHLALSLSHPRSSDEIWIVDVVSGQAVQCWGAMPAHLNPESFVLPELAHVRARDGLRVPLWVYLPAHTQGKVPAVMMIHGGPEAQERPSFQPFFQYLLRQGIAVIAPNIRGSTGYGTAYQRLIQGHVGDTDLLDLEACAVFAAQHPRIDADRMAVMGDSYGGFAALSCLTRLPQFWACGVALFAPSNLVTFVQTTQPTWRRYMEQLMGDPEMERQLLLERSPIHYVDNVQAPLLLIQGQNDARVPVQEADQFVQALRQRDKAVEYVVYPEEGHGFVRPDNQLDAHGRIRNFLFHHLVRR